MIPHRARLAPLAFVLLAWPRAAAAGDPDEAERLFNSGLKLMEAGKPGAACPAIEKSLALDPRPGTLFTLAECEALRGRIARAYARYDEYLNLFASLPPDKQAKQGTRPKEARAARDALGKRVPTLKIVLPERMPAGMIVERDDMRLADAVGGLAVPVEPGSHTVAATAPGMRPWRQTIDVPEGASIVIVVPALDVSAPARVTPEQAPPTASSGPPAQRIAGGVVLGLGVAGLAAGAALGVVAKGKWNDVLSRCADPTAKKGCDPRDQPKIDSAGHLADGATASLVLGGAAVVAGVVLLVTAPKLEQNTAWRLVVAPLRSGAAGGIEGTF